MRHGARLIVATAALLAFGCGGAAVTRPPRAAVATAPTADGRSTTDERTRWLEMFARGYFPGRSGQVFVVPKRGEVITEKDPLYRFMHGSPWDYDTRIPVLLYGRPFIRPGEWRDAVVQQDLAPTLGAIIDAGSLPIYTGRVIEQAILPGAARPRAVLVMVLDAMRADYFETHADVMPTLTRMRREGAWFPNARANTLPTVTGVGHATIGTGTDPRFHGITVNNLYNRTTGRWQPAYEALDPRELMTLTLADAWNLKTDGRAVIIGQGGALRATAGLVGHGACIVNGRKVIAASYSTRDAGWETNPDCYTMSTELQRFNGKQVWTEAGGTWMGHDIASPTKFRASSLYQRFEADALAAVIGHEPIGADEITDLILVNMKGPDYTAHAHGPESAELKQTLAELDRQMARILDLLDKKAGGGRTVVAVTADHGMPGEPPPGHRHHPQDIVAQIHERFDPTEKKVVQYYDDAANSQLYVDTARLSARGFSLRDLAAFLAQQEYFAAAFTEDEVRAAQKNLSSIK